MKKTALGILLALTLLAGAQTSTLYLTTHSLDPNTGRLTIDKIAMAALYDQEIRPLVQQQIAEAIATLPAGGIDQATMTAAIQAAEQKMWHRMTDADANNLRVFEQQRLNDTIAVLQARLVALEQ